VISHSSKKRDVIFLTQGPAFGSAIMRGYQIGSFLRKRGWKVRFFDCHRRLFGFRRIKDSIIVIVKEVLQRRKLLEALREKNVLVWDVVDYFAEACFKDREYAGDINRFFEAEKDFISHLGGVIFPNALFRDHWASRYDPGTITATIYHHWDPRFLENRAEDFRLVYLGGEENLDGVHAREIPELHVVPWSGAVQPKDLFQEIRAYSCHFSIQSNAYPHLVYKPPTKISSASATGSNIVLSRDANYLEILDGAYPYYANPELADIQEMVGYANDSYRSSVWNRGLEMMREVKEKTSIRNIAAQYTEFLKKFV
jgi:hypothetical protein